MTSVRLTSKLTGNTIEFIDEIKASGGMKDIYFSPDKSYVVGFFRNKSDPNQLERLRDICTRYRENLFNQSGGDYWESAFRWPHDLVERNGTIGVVVPFYENAFFFAHGSKNGDFLKIKGREKEGKWFSSASNREKFLDPREKGTYLSHLQICLSIARAVRRMHMAGLAHSDLSYKNVLVDPTSGKACLIDIDGLVVPGKYHPDVVGTPDFIAPEVIKTQHLDRKDPNRILPSVKTDRHALAVLIYMYLFYRHPLRGRKVHDQSPQRDEELSMGERALFVEHPLDASNRVRPEDLRKQSLPWGDPKARPYSMAGPVLKKLFEEAFIDGLHNPAKRPSAATWENALVRSIDLIQPCSAKCDMGWYVFDNSKAPSCPHCGTPYKGKLPVLNLYSQRRKGSYHYDDHRLMIWDGQSLFPWHIRTSVTPNEHLKQAEKKRVGYFQKHNESWWLVNETVVGMRNLGEGTIIPIGGRVKLEDGVNILLSPEDDGRMSLVQMSGT
ncbi:3-deoxy-D-manno-octulosonic-acid kinase [Pseudovibrio sp. W64]|uniref:helix-hairpin-helix domain-containing protein n=1 Tax=unclassified Pseudovibrio TaxID=2627060 RepID=UPI00070BE945|nr:MULTISPECIES: lipopolysaccharide kinase InaA family protein [unclassified Pseudovibrio]KZK79090.1 3-deoxy-D-manno-octulosonic-acid kinase [Pseudovibrio sp. W64]